MFSVMPHLSHSARQDVNNFFLGRGHHALAVDFNDAVTHSDPASFSNAPTHKATDLLRDRSALYMTIKFQFNRTASII